MPIYLDIFITLSIIGAGFAIFGIGYCLIHACDKYIPDAPIIPTPWDGKTERRARARAKRVQQ